MFFFSYAHLDPRGLHSFPTRRSSDLTANSAAAWRTRIGSFRFPTCVDSGLRTPTSTPTATQVGNLNEDRKSTRLNSSHQIISYAVFCLKKKKINIGNREL